MNNSGSGRDQKENDSLDLQHLRPLEELQGERTPSGPLEGAIRVDDSQATVPNGIIEPETKGRFGVEWVVLVISVLMLVFIAFIAWQVHLMTGPAKP
jgi:hypothetical protein